MMKFIMVTLGVDRSCKLSLRKGLAGRVDGVRCSHGRLGGEGNGACLQLHGGRMASLDLIDPLAPFEVLEGLGQRFYVKQRELKQRGQLGRICI